MAARRVGLPSYRISIYIVKGRSRLPGIGAGL
jgi:hypothetical protein